ncbi:ATP-binding protein [Rhabdochromatium marinum]|uniref:ATP-binding protein n=1 Tax=Rhabdochromatium marinum TaxID=48729 RepID=UPI0019087239|nr:ATP-binding protein [Rhabdochromatium marinum]MBK1649697.1 hypothetical protein [Rhabdochromatium marinum]
MKVHVSDTSDAVAQLIEQSESYLMEAGVPFAAVHAAILSLEEMVVNILKHGKLGDRSLDIEVALQLDAGCLMIDISDDGQPFDPTVAMPPDHIDAPLEDRPIGGLGIHLVKTLNDELIYRRSDGRNHLRMVKRLPEAGLTTASPPCPDSPPS